MSDYRSTAIKKEDLDDLKTNPIFDGLKEELKDPKIFDKIEKEVFKIMISDHKHREIRTFMKCKRCQAKMKKRSKYIKDRGFKDYHQYLSWKKVMELIKDNLMKDEKN